MNEEKLNISLSKFLQKHRITSDGKGMTLAELCYMYEPWILEEIKHIELSEKATDIYLEQAEIEIERLKEEYVMLQNASDEVEEELQQRIDRAIEYIENNSQIYIDTRGEELEEIDEFNNLCKPSKLLDILKGSDKE